MSDIPFHDFSKDDASSIAFKMIPLQVKSSYDSSVAHRHNYYEIFFFNKGDGTHEIDFKTFPILTDSVHFVSPGQVHCVRRELDTHGFVLLFSREFFSLQPENLAELFDMSFLHNSPYPVLNLHREQMNQLQGLLQNLETEQTNQGIHSDEVMRSLLKILLYHCDRFHRSLHPDQTWNRSELFRDFRLLLESDFTTCHKVSDYADKLNISEKKLNNCVKEATGHTVSDVIQDRVLLESKRLLLHSDFSIKEIAYYLGFVDQPHFTRFFKSHTGNNPTEFRAE